MNDPVAEKLLACATEIVAEGGFAGLRLRDVAKRAQVALGTPSFKFKDREGLLQAALQRAMDLHRDALEQALARGKGLDAQRAGFEVFWARVENALEFPRETLLRANAVYSSAVKGFREQVGQSASEVGRLVFGLVLRLRDEGFIRERHDEDCVFFAQQFLFSSFAISQSAALGAVTGEAVKVEAARLNVARSYQALFDGAADAARLEAQARRLLSPGPVASPFAGGARGQS